MQGEAMQNKALQSKAVPTSPSQNSPPPSQTPETITCDTLFPHPSFPQTRETVTCYTVSLAGLMRLRQYIGLMWLQPVMCHYCHIGPHSPEGVISCINRTYKNYVIQNRLRSLRYAILFFAMKARISSLVGICGSWRSSSE